MAQRDDMEQRRRKRAALEKKRQQEAMKMRRKLITGIGGIRIDRNIADMDAIRTAVTRMKEGHLLMKHR